MTTALRYRLFRMGRFTPEQQQRVAAGGPGVVLARQGIAVKSVSAGLKLPGQKRNSGSRSMVGALVITASAVHPSLGSLYLGVVDPDPNRPADGPAVLTLGRAGVTVDVDVGRLVAGGSGTARVTFPVPIDDGTLGLLGARSAILPMTQVLAQRLSRRL